MLKTEKFPQMAQSQNLSLKKNPKDNNSKHPDESWFIHYLSVSQTFQFHRIKIYDAHDPDP